MSGPQTTQTHAELMRSMGSKDGFDPMPPSQHRYFLDVSESPANRTMALLWSCTIHPGKNGRRSGFAKDKHGRAMRQADFARELRISPQNMTTVIKRLSETRRLRVDEQGRIWLRGDVQEPQLLTGEEKENIDEGVFCTKDFPSFVAEYLQQLPENDRREATAALLERRELHKQWKADAMALVRAKEDEDIVGVLQMYGYQQEARPGRPRRERPQPTVQVIIHEPVESFVQKTKPPREQNEIASVQNAHPYGTELQSYRESSSSSVEAPPAPQEAATPAAKTTTTKPKPASPNTEEAELIAAEGDIELKQARKLLADCREKTPDATVEEVLYFVRVKKPLTERREVKNPGAYLCSAVLECFAPEEIRRHRQKRSGQKAQQQAPAARPAAEQIRELERFLAEHGEDRQVRAALEELRAQEAASAAPAQAKAAAGGVER